MNKSFLLVLLFAGILISSCAPTEEAGGAGIAGAEKTVPAETVSAKFKETAVGENCGEADYSEVTLPTIAFKEKITPRAKTILECMNKHLEDCSPAYFTTTGDIGGKFSIKGKSKGKWAKFGWCLISMEYGKVRKRDPIKDLKKYANTFLDCDTQPENIEHVLGEKGHGFPQLMQQMGTLVALEQGTTCTGTMRDVGLGKIKPEDIAKEVAEEKKPVTEPEKGMVFDGRIIKTLKDSKLSIESIAKDSKYLYACGGDGKLYVWDKSDWSIHSAMGTCKRFVAADGTYSYASTGKGVNVVYPDTDGLFKNIAVKNDVESIAADSEYLYIATYDGVEVFDSSKEWRKVGSVAYNGHTSDLVSDSDNFYVAGYFGVKVVSLSDWGVIKEFEPNAAKQATNVAVDDDYLYVSTGKGIVEVWDKSDWSLVESLEASGPGQLAVPIAVDDVYVYAAGQDVIIVFKKSDWSKLKSIKTDWLRDIEVDEKQFYANSGTKLHIYNIHATEEEVKSKEAIEKEKEEAMKVKGDDNAFKEKLFQTGNKYFDFSLKTDDWEMLDSQIFAPESNFPLQRTTKLPVMEHRSDEIVMVDYYYIESKEELKGSKEEVNGEKVVYGGIGEVRGRWYFFDCNVGRIAVYYMIATGDKFDPVEKFPRNIKSLITSLMDTCKAESEEIRP